MSEANGVTLYEQLKAAGCEIDNHYSDLYVLWTEEAGRIVRASGHSFTLFRSEIDGKTWADVPFSFDPYWDRAARAAGGAR